MRRSRKALVITDTELKLMATAAIMGAQQANKWIQHPSGHGCSRQTQCLAGHGKLGGLEVAPFDLAASGQGEESHQVEQELALVLPIPVTRLPGEGEAGISQAAGLDQIGLGDAQFRQARLQPPVVEDGDLDRAVRIQGFRQQAFHLVSHAAGILVRADGLGSDGHAFPGDVRHLAQAAVRAEGGAAPQ